MLTKVVQNFEEHQQAGLLVPIKQEGRKEEITSKTSP
jgi:hypothetical protein